MGYEARAKAREMERMEKKIRTQITIALLEDGQIVVSAPKETVLSYGLLEVAKDVVRHQSQTKEMPRVVPAMAIPALKRVQ